MQITARSVTRLYDDLIWNLHGMRNVGSLHEENTRQGKVYALEEPMVLQLLNPLDRVMYETGRNPNPFFHYMEILWNIAGDASSDWICLFNKNLKQFTEDDGHFHGAYGQRWRFTFGFDQIAEVVRMLSDDMTTRRAVLSMWSPSLDLGADKRDIPCNFALTFRVMGGRLNMYVHNRSNDLIWGMLGANVVTFSAILEMIARLTSLEVGSLYQISTNAHIYERHWSLIDYVPRMADLPECLEMFPRIPCGQNPLTTLNVWRAEICDFMDNNLEGPFELDTLNRVAVPMYHYYVLRDPAALDRIGDEAWRLAAVAWKEVNRDK